MLDEQLGDLLVEVGDPRVEIRDVFSELPNAASCSARCKAGPQLESFELVQLALAVAAAHAGLCDWVVLDPVRAQPLDRLGAVADKASAVKLEHPERPDQFGLLSRAEVLALRAHHVSDRE